MERFTLSIRDRHGFERTMPITRTVVMGRQSNCDLVLSDSMVSRNHLRVEIINGQCWVEDLQSSHGSFIGSARLGREQWTPHTTVRIADGAYMLDLRCDSQTTTEVHLHAILQTAQLLGTEIELEDLLEQSLDRLLTISGTDRGFLMLLEGGELATKVTRNLGSEVEQSIQLSMSSVHAVFEKGEPIWIHNASDDERYNAQQSIVNLQLKTILCLPLTLQGRRIGVVYLDSKRIITDPVDRPTLEAIVALCSIAIERTRLSEENLHNQVLATVGQVASSIVHDFKNALWAVRGHAELLQDITGEPKAKHHILRILEAVERLNQLSMDVLDYAKVREPQTEMVELSKYMTAFVENHQAHAAEMGVTLRAEDNPCSALIDKHRFGRVIENVLANALDAVAEIRGEVVLSWDRVTGGAQIRVQDNGKGIPKKILKRIYEPFFSYGKQKGTGLGMATVKKIVEEHKGTLELQSEEGQGTLVIITLPDGTAATVDTGSFHTTTGKNPVINPQ